MEGLDNEKRAGALKRTAGEVRAYRTRMKILSTALILLILLAGSTYGFAALYKKTGSFTVSINKYDMTKYGLSLSESRDMLRKTSHLNAKISKDMTNIAGEFIPDNVDMIDGEHNGDNYVAYTFYLQNAGEVEVACDYQMNITGITNSLDEAVRVRLYVDGTPTTYAKTASDGSGPEPGTEEFYSVSVIARGRHETLNPGDTVKYTVVIWIEGNDPDCVDWLIGGKLRVSMQMGIVH